MYLPRTRQPEESFATTALAPIEMGRENVLVVEDDAVVREGAIDMLKDLGYRVLQAANAEAALAIIGSGAAIDILFTDVVMPGPIKTRAGGPASRHPRRPISRGSRPWPPTPSTRWF